MRDFVNEKARLLQPSGIRKFFDIVRETEGAISLGVGEPDFVTPWSVRSAAIASLQRGYTQYTANRGMPALLELIARYLETRFSLSFDPAHILLTVGASEGIDLLLRACVERGDEILIPDPAYVSYAPCALMADGTPVAVKCREENGFVPTAEDLEAAEASLSGRPHTGRTHLKIRLYCACANSFPRPYAKYRMRRAIPVPAQD